MNNVPVGINIARIKLMQERIFSGILKNMGIDAFNGPQGRILFNLWTEDNISISELSKETALAKTTLTSMIDRLEAQGHIMRVQNPNDRREIRVVVNENTKELQEPYNIALAKMRKINYKGFTQDEIEDFEEKLKRLLNNLCEYTEDEEK